MAANITITRSTNFFNDQDEQGVFDPGDVLYTRVTIQNNGDQNATNVRFMDSFTGTTLIAGTLNVSPIAFNDAFTAVANTVLRVGGAGTINGGESIVVTGNLLSNDRGSASLGTGIIVGDSVPGFQIVTVTGGVSAKGGTFNIFSDGSFNYVNDGTDSEVDLTGGDTFTYTIRDAGLDGTLGNADDLTSTATVTISFVLQGAAGSPVHRVWYVDPSAAPGGDGTSAKPFQGITALNGAGGSGDADSAGHVLYVKGTVSGALQLEASQKLIGTGEELLVGGFQITPDGGTNSALNAAGGFAVSLSTNNTIAGINLGGTGGIAGASFGTLTVTDDVVINTTGQALNISSGTFAGTGFASVSSTSGGNNIALAQIDGTVNLGGGALSGATATGATGGSLRVSGGTATVNYSGTISQAAVDAPAVTINTGHNTGTVTLSGNITATNGTGLQFSNADGTYIFSGTNALNGGNAGIDILDGSSGTFTFGSGTSITSPAGIALNVDSSTATITYNGSITQAANFAMVNVSNHSAGTITFNGGVLQATNGTGLQFSNADGTYNINNNNGATILNGGDAGVDIVNGSDGTFLFGSNVNLQTASGTNFNVNGGGGNITLNGTINDDIGQLISIQSRTGGTVAFNGTITDGFDGDGSGIAILNNTGGAINFNNSVQLSTGANAALTMTGNSGTASVNFSGAGAGLDIVTTTGIGINATGAGNLVILGSGNTVSTGAATAVNISGVTIGSGGVTFTSVNSNGGNGSGIILNNAGSGGFTVTGTGSAGTGGTIQNKTQASVNGELDGTGVYINNTNNVSLAWMNINSNANYGVRGENSSGLTIRNSVFSGNGNSNDAGREGSIILDQVTGTVNILNNTIGGGHMHNVRIDNQSGTLNLNFTGNYVHSTALNGGDDGLTIEAENTATMFLNIANNRFQAHGGDHFNMSLINNANVNLSFTGNDLDGGHGNTLGQGIFVLGSTFNGNFVYNISNNGTVADPIDGNVQGGAIHVTQGSGTGSFSGTIANNVIGDPAVANSGSVQASGILVAQRGNGTHTVHVHNNQVYQYEDRGIIVEAGEGNGRLNATITSNLISNPADPVNSLHGIHFDFGVLSTDNNQVYLDVRNNNFTNAGNEPGGGSDLRMRVGGSVDVFLEGLTAGPKTSTDYTNYFAANNSVTTQSHSLPATGTRNGFVGDVPMPASPTLPPAAMLAEAPPSPAAQTEQPVEGGQSNQQHGAPIPADDGDAPAPAPAPAPSPAPSGPVVVDDGVLSAAELAFIVEAAIQRWIAAGATEEQVAAMRAVDIAVTNLGGLTLGESGLGKITIDDDAGGWRWFIDSTPGGDEEYTGSGTALTATDRNGQAGTRIDLLTVIMHELGHQLGLSDIYAPGEQDELMFGTIRAGERRLPGADDLHYAKDGPIAGAFAIAEMNLGTLEPGRTVVIEWRHTVNSPAEGGLAGFLSGQSTVSSDQTAAVSSAVQSGLIDSLTLGNFIFHDVNKNGVYDAATDTGVNGVTLTLHVDTNNNGVYDPGTDLHVGYNEVNGTPGYQAGFDTPAAAGTGTPLTTTSLNGVYSFAGLAPGNYIVVVNASNFQSGGALVGKSAVDSPADPNNNAENDNNVQALNGAVATRSIRLDYGLETSGGPNGSANDTNNTLDLAFVQPNLAPSGTDATIAINEDSPRTLVIANFGYTDADGNALLEIRINSVTGGTLTVNGTAVSTFPATITPTQLNAGEVVFTPTQNLNGSGAAAIAFQVRDNGGTASGGIDTDQSANTITFNITAVNDAPAGANNGASVMDNATHVFTVADFSTGLTDANDSPANSFAGVRITTLPPVQAGIIYYDADGAGGAAPVAISAGDSFTALDLSTGKLTFVPATGSGNTAPVFTFQVRDNGGTANGGVDLDPNPDTFTLTISQSNIAPDIDLDEFTSGNNAEANYVEDDGALLVAPNLTVSDNDDATLTGARIAIGAGFIAGADALTINGAASGTVTGISYSYDSATGILTLTGTASLAEYQTLLRLVKFDTSSNAPGTSREIGFTVNDGDADSAVRTAVLTITETNDAPVIDLNGAAAGIDTTLAYTEGDDRVAITPDLVVSDPDSGNFDGGRLLVSGQLNEADRIELIGDAFAIDPEDDSILVNGVNIGKITIGTDSVQIDFNANATAALVQQVLRAVHFVAQGDAPAAGDREITYELTDGDGGTSTVATATITVTPVNDLTVPADDTGNVAENGTTTIDVLNNDADPDGPGKQVTHVDGQPIAPGGTVTLTGSGAKVTLNNDGTLTYDPNGKFNDLTESKTGGTNTSGTDSFTYTEADGGTATVKVTVNGVASVGDRIVGGPGDNIFTVDDFDDEVIENPNEGTDTVRTALGSRSATPSYSDLYVIPANVEYLIGTATGGQGVRDNGLDNVITMDGGNDLVVADQGGADQVNGGGGNDFLFFGATFGAGDIVNGGAGTDTLGLLGGGGATFGADQLVSIERIAVYSSAFNGPGEYSYTLVMNDGNVAAGEELLVTAASLKSGETLTFDGSAETNGRFAVVGGAGDDDITGGAQKDYLNGGDGADILKGGDGNDVLLGGRGADKLTGGAGKDWFRFESATDSNRDDGVDTITDFGGSASGERIDLSAIDADINTEGNQAFTWIGTNGAFTEQAGQLRVVQTEGKWFVEGDVDGDGVADIVIHVDMGPDYIWNSSDFIV